MVKPIPSFIGEFVEIDLSIPQGLRWRIKRGNRIKAGEPAGSALYVRGNKSNCVYQFELMNTVYYNHRVIYYLSTGIDPLDSFIDHKNHYNNNGILREATPSQNTQNSRPRKNTSSKYKGVSWHKRNKKWVSNITLNGKRKYLGSFETEEEAAFAYNKEALNLFGDFAYLNPI